MAQTRKKTDDCFLYGFDLFSIASIPVEEPSNSCARLSLVGIIAVLCVGYVVLLYVYTTHGCWCRMASESLADVNFTDSLRGEDGSQTITA